MQWKRDGNNVIIRLDKGEDVKEKILEVSGENGFKAGSILWAVGMIQNLEVGYFNGKQYERDTFRGPLEVVSFHGSIAENDPYLHIHTSAADRGHGVIGGHLFSGIANPLLEIHITGLESITLKRKYNEDSTLNELDIS